MAVLERGKGKRKQVVEIVQLGAVLRSQETEGGDQRLPGYRRFTDAAAASAALAGEVLAHLKDGMQPADEAARAIVAAQPAPSGPPTLPLRRDLGIENEATGFVITSRKMAGKAMDEGSPEWKKAVGRGDLLPLMLIQDDPFILRVVAGEPLTGQEAGEWVARVDAHLNIPDGKLCVTGGSIFSNDDYDADDPYYEQYVGEVAIPKGRYRATLYAHLHGVNGGAVMDHLAGGYGKGESVDEWFARTRPGMEKPAWDDQELVGFLLHLEPVEAAPKAGLSELPADGWFGGVENARKPDRCPLGLVAKDVVRRRQEAAGQWMFVREVFPLKPKAEPVSVTGGAVSLPLASIGRAARIAWFASRLAAFELRVILPAGAAIDLRGTWPEGVVAAHDGGVVRILFDADLVPVDVLARFAGLGPQLAAMPNGSALELCCAPIEHMPGAPEDAGLLALGGPIEEGHWRIASAYPPAPPAELEAALTLAAQVDAGAAIADAIAAFAERHAGTWPVVTIAADDEYDETEW